MSGRALRAVTAALATIPVATGMLTMMGVDDPIYRSAGIPRDALLDSNLRFLGGLWLVAGIAMFTTIPRIEHQATLFRTLWAMVFVGGVGRLLSMFTTGLPPWPFVAFTALELLGAPLFIAWQARVAAR